MEAKETLPFKVDPHIVEDLGLNLYTSLPRVLAEFVANAYDADSSSAEITADFAALKAERRPRDEDPSRRGLGACRTR